MADLTNPKFEPGQTITFNAGQHGQALFKIQSIEPASEYMGRVDEDDKVYVVDVIESSHLDYRENTEDFIPVGNAHLRLQK